MQKIRYSFWGILTICALSVLFSGVSIFLLFEIKGQTSTLYQHPYTVGKEAHELLVRFTDTNFSYRSFLLADTTPQKDLVLILQERFRRQRMVRDKIEERYTGPKKDVEKLSRMLDAFHKALLQGLPYASLPPAEIRLYLDTEVESAYQDLKESIEIIVRFTNRKILNIEKESSFTVNIAITCSLLLVLVVLTVAFFFYRLQKKGEQAIAYREKLFDILCNSIDDVFVIYHVRDKRIEYVSGNADRILGLGNNDISTLHSRLSAANQKVLDDFSKQAPFDAPKGCDFSMKDTLTGEDRFMHLHLYPVKENAGTIRYVVSLSDRTHEVKTRQTLKDALASAQQANTAKRDFLSRMSHEIRTPMNAIIGMATIAAAHIQNHGRVADCLHKISFSSKHLMSLLNDVLDMSKIESGKLAVHHEEFESI
ncbi:MAG: sensor histidine kinase [Bilophila wadsworthia]